MDQHRPAFDLYVYAAYVVAALVHRLDQEFGDLYRFVDQRFDRFDRRVHRAVSGAGGRAFAVADLDDDRRGGDQRAGQDLQVFQFDPLADLFAGGGPDQIEQVVVADVLLLVGQFEELGVYFVQFFLFEFESEQFEPVVQRPRPEG